MEALLGVVLAVALVGYFLMINTAGANVPMMTGPLNAGQIAQYAAAAGFSGDDLTIAIAVALAESSGNPSAHGDLSLGSGTGSFGLWQIYSDAHPEYGPDFQKLYDPATNAAAAFAVYQAAGQSFDPWSTFKSGKYLAYLDAAESGVSA